MSRQVKISRLSGSAGWPIPPAGWSASRQIWQSYSKKRFGVRKFLPDLLQSVSTIVGNEVFDCQVKHPIVIKVVEYRTANQSFDSSKYLQWNFESIYTRPDRQTNNYKLLIDKTTDLLQMWIMQPDQSKHNHFHWWLRTQYHC